MACKKYDIAPFKTEETVMTVKYVGHMVRQAPVYPSDGADNLSHTTGHCTVTITLGVKYAVRDGQQLCGICVE